jgi:hypothetical protein
VANQEMYDYLEDVSPDVEQTLSVTPQDIIYITGDKKIAIHKGDDRSEERIILSDQSEFWVILQWIKLSSSDSGTIMNFFHSTSYGCAQAKSFWWTPPANWDGHTYVVRFDGPLNQFWKNYLVYGVTNLRLYVLGRKPD